MSETLPTTPNNTALKTRDCNDDTLQANAENRKSISPSLSRVDVANKRKSLLHTVIIPDHPLAGSTPSVQPSSDHLRSHGKEDIMISPLGGKTRVKNESIKVKNDDDKMKNNSNDDILKLLAAKEMKIMERKSKIIHLNKLIQIEKKKFQLEKIEIDNLKKKLTTNINHSVSIEMTDEENNANHSMWSKSLSLLNSMDKSLFDDLPTSNNIRPRSMASIGSQTDLQSSFDEEDEVDDDDDDDNDDELDIGKAVSNSLWNFVNDVKAGLLGIDETEGEDSSSKNNTNNKGRKSSLNPSSNVRIRISSSCDDMKFNATQNSKNPNDILRSSEFKQFKTAVRVNSPNFKQFSTSNPSSSSETNSRLSSRRNSRRNSDNKLNFS
ncbi:hypothetical protein TBLA_0C06540 [Henningerozyma blattae CBS 6284]|uniref:Topoisomerase I damage affected protein 11 n=1 Tax=Henningerozyma blattae (strain ATCC 34711 / CBS 6284 / DSM 70876 / NBRC 10599 / NRRL Y-10934 / UCD 77-7) TaxID=1071380 RepID=I2H245_HENB6|nr:hypothetical protein TBLA_0C06540 [Tetrapisispora blattae CBS 6284]CCH60447.1 hypothetical protein TBLA_0C06540 [Tetrapisispora blattae CBS 6284]